MADHSTPYSLLSHYYILPAFPEHPSIPSQSLRFSGAFLNCFHSARPYHHTPTHPLVNITLSVNSPNDCRDDAWVDDRSLMP